MNISLNGLVVNCYNFIKDKMSNLNPLQKKVAIFALAFFSCATIGYFIFHCYWFTAQRLSKKQVNQEIGLALPSRGDLTPKSQDSDVLKHVVVDSFQANPFMRKVSVPVAIGVQRKDSRQEDIERRLEKNRNYARLQQEKEKKKPFVISPGECPREFHGQPIIMEHTAKIDGKRIGVASCQGVRTSMEDTDLIVLHTPVRVNGKIYYADIFAICDGHGGNAAANFIKSHLEEYLTEALENHNRENLTDVGIWDALKVCCRKIDEAFPGHQGTTVAIAILLEGKIWVANVGDSRVVLQKDGKVTQASEDAKPEIARYRKKIEKLGGSVVLGQGGCYRVNGDLAVARAIGDKYIIGNTGKCCISPNPKITCYNLDEYRGGHLIIACDGLYDVATSDGVGKAVDQMAKVRGDSPSVMAARLVNGALMHRSRDNVSVLIAEL